MGKIGTAERVEIIFLIPEFLSCLIVSVVSVVPILPIFPMSLPTSFSALFLARRVADATLGKNPDDGLYMKYCSLSGLSFC